MPCIDKGWRFIVPSALASSLGSDIEAFFFDPIILGSPNRGLVSPFNMDSC
jgi:hypothetical protein